MSTGLAIVQREETAPVNSMPASARLVLGNYCTRSGVSASATSVLSGFPASGAIDGNRTEANTQIRGYLPPWISNAAPSLGSPQVLTIDLGVSRRANFFKLYFSVGSRPLTYMVSVSTDNVTYTDLFGTSDIAAAGVSPAFTITDPGTGVIAVRTNSDLSYNTFRYVKLTIYRMTTPTDKANCVELEVYRKLDVTPYVNGFQTSADLDYRLNDILASTAALTLSNKDRRFSIDYAQRTRDGDQFFNDELKPGIGLEINVGSSPATASRATTSYGVLHDDTSSTPSILWNDLTDVPVGFKITLDANLGTLDSYGGSGNIMRVQIKMIGRQWTVDFYHDRLYEEEAGVAFTYNCDGNHVWKIVCLPDSTLDIYRDGVLITNLGSGVADSPGNGTVWWLPTYSPTYAHRKIEGARVSTYAYDDGAVRLFTGNLDRPTIKPGAREVTMEFRDGMKEMIRRIASAGLLSSFDIGDCMKNILRLANISDYEMSVDATAIILSTFFTTEEDILTTARDLVTACGDATLYFDENNKAVFRMFQAIALEHLFTYAADFEAGIATFQDVTDWSDEIQREWFMIDDFADGNFTSNPVWTDQGVSNVTTLAVWSVPSNVLKFTITDLGGKTAVAIGSIRTPFTDMTGRWRLRMKVPTVTPGPAGTTGTEIWITAQGWLTNTFRKGYYVRFPAKNGDGVGIYRSDDYNSDTALVTAATGLANGTYADITIRRDSDGNIHVYKDGTLICETSSPDTTYGSGGLFGFGARDTEPEFDDIYFSHAEKAPSTVSTSQAIWVSDKIDQGAYITSEGVLAATTLIPSGTTLTFETRTSTDGSSWGAWTAVTPGSTIGSTALRWIQLRITFNVPQDSAGHNGDTRGPIVYDITLNWNAFAGSVKIPASSSRTIRYDDVILDISQELTDTLGGTSAIANLVTCQAQPIVLGGNDGDVQWQGTTQIPPVPISVSAPLQVHNGDVLTYNAVLNNPTDVSLMSGANPAAAVVTFGSGAAGTWKFTTAHPSRPVLQITVTADGTITGLSIQGKTYSVAAYGLKETSQDDSSILQYGIGSRPVSSPWIQQNSVAKSIAAKVVSLFAQPFGQITDLKIRFTPTIKRRDRITVVDDNTAISRDFLVMGINHRYAVGVGGASTETVLRVFAI